MYEQEAETEWPDATGVEVRVLARLREMPAKVTAVRKDGGWRVLIEVMDSEGACVVGCGPDRQLALIAASVGLSEHQNRVA